MNRRRHLVDLTAAVLLTATLDAGAMAAGPSAAPRSAPPQHLEGHILFGRTTGGDLEGVDYTANADGTGERQLAVPAGYCCPKTSPDGSRIMVMTDAQPAGGPITGYTVAADGSDPVRLPLTDPALNLVPQAWSPDGTRMAFEGWDDSDPSRTGAYTARWADGGDLVRLTAVEGEVHDIPSDYSPDGTRLVLYRMPDSGEWDIGGSLWVVNVDGTDAHRLDTEDTVPSWWARWSPDGTRILFATARNQATGALWTVNADGSGLTKVFEDGEGRFAIQPAWSPDGSQIMFPLDPIADAFTHPSNGIYVVNADGTGLSLVIGDPSFKGNLEWRP